MRADARRNYDRLVASARAAFAELGADAPLDDIAQRAGVGNATLYRHFPTRQALLEAVFRDHIDVLCRRAEELMSAPSPGVALREWLGAVIAQGSTERGLAASLQAALGEDGSSCRAAMFGAARGLLARAQEAGDVRTGVPVEQLFKLVNAIALVTETEPDAAGHAATLLDLIFHGLTPRPLR
ncbi:TetR/AcrR family transcriptional regulator [Microtetraspora sp. AC03309]|uniref:TetR/AcrR family transcriptional regulator n=1 Tax=Microtetraspora sp. AC03309 TaxID=2779376 RepID=UPI001E2EA794|nr:TetR/AcrR family transcriptional regulator [Microtetraspora sp. AC03309]MCC5582058.1 TetR/AcrR family transcriptional regulator [Microtetraspora sp. AC03309]